MSVFSLQGRCQSLGCAVHSVRRGLFALSMMLFAGVASIPASAETLEQALAARNPDRDRLTHHSDRGVQYLSIKYSERLEEAKIGASVGSVGDSYDNALAETINGLYKTEVIEHEGPWRGKKDVELATLDWVHWYNEKRLYGPLGYISPATAERNFYQAQLTAKIAAE